MRDLAIIVPLYNEEHRLPAAMPALINYAVMRDALIVLVPNGCTDGTIDMCKWYAARSSHVAWLESPKGKGAAIKTGMLETNAKLKYMCDVDLSTPVDEIDKFIYQQMHGYDVVIGSRKITSAHASPLRRLSSVAFHMAVNSVVPGIEDTQCGFKLFTDRAAKTVFPALTLGGWAFDVEALYLAQHAGLKIKEIPVVWKHNEDSRINLVRDSARMLLDVISIPGLH